MPEMIKRYFMMTPILVEAWCKICKESLSNLQEISLSNPPVYLHVCPKCGSEFHLDKSYPYMDYQQLKTKIPFGKE